MQLLKLVPLLIAISHICGCGKDAASVATGVATVPHDPSATTSDHAHQFTEADAPEFDPKLTPRMAERSRRKPPAHQRGASR